MGGQIINAKQSEGLSITATSVDFASCKITNENLPPVLQLFEVYNIPVHRLKLYDNEISDAQPLVDFLDSPAGAEIKEIHLSHNQLDDAQCTELVGKCAALGPNPGPIWLRLEHNSVETPESVIADYTEPQVVKAMGIRGVSEETSVAIHMSFFGECEAPSRPKGKGLGLKGKGKGKSGVVNRADGGKGKPSAKGGKGMGKSVIKGGIKSAVTPGRMAFPATQNSTIRAPRLNLQSRIAITSNTRPTPFAMKSAAITTRSLGVVAPRAQQQGVRQVPTRERPIVAGKGAAQMVGGKRLAGAAPSIWGPPPKIVRKGAPLLPPASNAGTIGKRINVAAQGARKIPVPPAGKGGGKAAYKPPTSKASGVKPTMVKGALRPFKADK